MQRSFFLLLAGLCVTTSGWAQSAPVGPLPRDVTPTHYRLKLTIDPRQEDFSGETNIDVTVHHATRVIWLHGMGLKVTAVSVTSGKRQIPAQYAEVDHEFGIARVTTDTAVPAGKASLHFSYSAPFQSTGQGLYHTRIANDWYAFTQFEAIDARRAFPGFDEPGFKTPFDLTLTAPASDRVVTNTPEVRAVKLKDHLLRHEFATTRPLPTYLLAFVAGPVDIVELPPIAPNAARPTPLPLRIVAAKGQGPRTAFAGSEAPKLLSALEGYFGMPFPYAKLDLIASPLGGGAMENAGAIIFDESLLLFGDHPPPRQQQIFGVVAAHEMAHQWFGDLVTPVWWDDIWLNESFAEWMGVKISDAWRPDLGIHADQMRQTLKAMDTDALRAGRQIHQPIRSNAQISGGFDNITYQKGAGVLGMIESYLGEERFRKGVRLHLQRHAYSVATAAEFFAAMAEGSGDPGVIDAFRSFVDQAGVPLVTVTAAPDGRSLTLGQSRYRPLGSEGADSEVWKIPVCVDVIGATHSSKTCTLLTSRTGTLALGPDAVGAVIHPNADGAGYYRFAVDAGTFKGLLAAVPKLPPREALSFADSVGAAFDAGKLSFTDLLAAAGVLANHPDRVASLHLGHKLEFVRDRVASAAQRAPLQKKIDAIYKPRLQALGFDPAAGRYAGDPSEQQLLRGELIRIVALGGRDAEVRRVLTQAADRSLDDSKALEPGIRGTAWGVAVQELGKPFADKIAPLAFSSTDPHLRQDAVAGLADAESSPVAEEARALVLDKRGDVTATVRVIFIQMRNPVTRQATWQWLGTNQEALFARVPGMFQFFLAQLGDPFCSKAERARFDSVLGERLSKVSGGELQVGRTRETIDDCAALKDKLAPELRAALGTAQ
ncbi:MAG TPA: M1 family aminopeptidase [Steroidobacteraceae bacterium]|jgi:aminopeptidase N|nr:M1 family aminopeptidase [Steroidobacteraceae bacterium]